jgi:hypothetical protein
MDTSYMPAAEWNTVRDFIEGNGKLPDKVASQGVFGKCYDLTGLSSEIDTEKLIDNLVPVMTIPS